MKARAVDSEQEAFTVIVDLDSEHPPRFDVTDEPRGAVDLCHDWHRFGT